MNGEEKPIGWVIKCTCVSCHPATISIVKCDTICFTVYKVTKDYFKSIKLRKYVKITPNCQLNFSSNYVDFFRFLCVGITELLCHTQEKNIDLWKHPHLQ